jgi:Helicase HerA, central domain
MHIEVAPPYRLRDTGGRALALAELTDLVLALDGPAQVWHGTVECELDPPGRGAAVELTRRLARAARPFATRLTTDDASPVSSENVRSEHRRHLVLDDGRVARVLALQTWPAAVTPDWLGPIAASCSAVALHLRPLSQPVAARLLRRRLAAMTANAYVDAQAGRLTDAAVTAASNAADDLRHAVALGSTRLVSVQVLFGVTAESTAGLDVAEHDVRRALAPHVAEVQVLSWQQVPGWAALAVGGQALAWPWRLVDAGSAAATIPHPVGPPAGEPTGGTLVGRDPSSGVPLVVDRFALHNPNRLVVGTSGAGKSYATKLELLRQLAAGTRAVVIDPEGEFGPLADVVQGLTLAVGEETAGLDPVGLACSPSLPATEGMAVLAGWAAALLGEPLSSVDLALLDRALGVLRADRRAMGSSAIELLSVVADIANHRPFTGSDLAARLDPAASGSIAGLFAPNPDLADLPALVVFDLRAVPARVRPAVMSCVLTRAWAQTVGAPTGQRQLVVLDEAHLLLEDPAAADLLAQFARRARKYGVALDVVTQRLSDFLTHPAGEAVLANTSTKLLLGCEDRERVAIATGLGLTAPEAELLRAGRRGSGLLLTPTLRSPVDIVADDAEHILAGSGPR